MKKEKKMKTNYYISTISCTPVDETNLLEVSKRFTIWTLKSAYNNSGVEYWYDRMIECVNGRGDGMDIAMNVYTSGLKLLTDCYDIPCFGSMVWYKNKLLTVSYGRNYERYEIVEKAFYEMLLFFADKEVNGLRKDALYKSDMIPEYENGDIVSWYYSPNYDNSYTTGDVEREKILKTIKEDFSDTDLKCIEYLCKGLSYRDIGKQLGVSHVAVSKRMKRILKSLSVNEHVLSLRYYDHDRMVNDEKELNKSIELLNNMPIDKHTYDDIVPYGVKYSQQTYQHVCYESECFTGGMLNLANIAIVEWLKDNACLDISKKDAQSYSDIVSQFIDW